MNKKELKTEQFEILWDNVLVKPKKVERKDGFVRPQQEEDKSELGEVVGIGIGLGEDLPIKVGSIILFNKYSTTGTDVDENLIVRAEDIVAVLNK